MATGEFTAFDGPLTKERATRLRARLLSGEHRPVCPEDRKPMIAWCDEVIAQKEKPQ